MKLKRVRVTNFKSVLDSEWFTVEDLTCLVGKNESGKTALLEALERLNSVRSERSQFREIEYPRMNWSEYEETPDVDVAVFSEWELDDEEKDHIAALAGEGVELQPGPVTVSKDYDNTLAWSIPLDFNAAVNRALETSDLSAADLEPLRVARTTSALLKALDELPDPTPAQAAFRQSLRERWSDGGLQHAVSEYLTTRLPRFVYYSHYDRLPGRMALDELIAAQAADDFGRVPGARVFLALLSMVGTSPGQIAGIATSEGLISKLEAVENRLSRKIFRFWSQNQHLKVRFRFDQASPDDVPPFDSGKIFQTRIENTRHEATIGLDERSTGFIWFFSFLVWFSEVQREFGENLVVLLDEPGLTLHARAQADLLDYIRAELLSKYQVIYTTHSPFMIDARDVASCRTVEDATSPEGVVLGTKVGDRVLSADRDTVFPLQAALGYEVTRSLTIGEHPLLVEGPADLLYLGWASERLRAEGRKGLDPRWTVTPCGGLSSVPSFLALLGRDDPQAAVLAGAHDACAVGVRGLTDAEFLQSRRIIETASYAEDGAPVVGIEGVLGASAHGELVRLTHGLPGSEANEVDRLAAARYLLEHPAALGETEPGALDRFERLFDDLNGLL